MKLSTVIITIVAVVLLVVVFLLWPRSESGQKTLSKDYKPFYGEKPYLALSFRYSSGWRLMEDKGKLEIYTQAMMLGPRNADDTYTASIVMRGSPLKSKKGRFENIEQVKQNYMTHLYKDPVFLDQTGMKVQNHPAQELTVIYTIPPMHHKPMNHKALKSIPIPVKARAVFTQDGENLYEFIYSADERDFEKYTREFEVVLKSLRFVSAS